MGFWLLRTSSAPHANSELWYSFFGADQVGCLKTPAVGAPSLVARERFMLRIMGTKNVTLLLVLNFNHLVPVQKTLRTPERE